MWGDTVTRPVTEFEGGRKTSNEGYTALPEGKRKK